MLTQRKALVSKVKKLQSKALKPKKVLTHRFLTIFSRHPSISPLRRSVLIKGKKVVYRHGSTTESSIPYEINSAKSVKISADKLAMKEAFDKAGVSHASWKKLSDYDKADFKKWLADIKFPEKHLIIKHRYGSRGTGNHLVTSQENLRSFIDAHKGGLGSYIVEEYKNYSVEYRLHVSARGCFNTCRKVLKKDTPKEKRFQRHDDNCSWLIETNPGFDKPAKWDLIVEDCKKALAAIGADVLAFDVKCTAKHNSKGKLKEDFKWIIIESCSAPSFGDRMMEAYRKELPLIVEHKYNK